MNPLTYGIQAGGVKAWCSSWLNVIERWFREITDKRIRRGTFKNVQQLIAAIQEYIEQHNSSPEPFVWTAKADDNLKWTPRGLTRARSLVSTYLLDTNVWIEYLRGRNLRIAAKIQSLRPRDISMSAVTVGELSYGAYRNADLAANPALLDELRASLVSLPFDEVAAD